MTQHQSVSRHHIRMHHVRIIALSPLLLLSCLLGASLAGPARAEEPGDEDYVRFTLEAPAASPYHIIRYEITRRRPATTAVHRRQLPGLSEGLHALGLLTPEEAAAFFAQAKELDAGSLPAVPAGPTTTPGALTWRCDLMLDGKRHVFVASDLENLPDRRYARLFDAVRRTVLLRAGELPFRNVYFPAKERGWLNIESVPAATVTLDGFDTRLETPMYSYDIAAGTHTVTLRSLDGRYERTFEVRVEAQGTTTLRIDLR
jgi:hypothetical protein